MKNYSYRRAWGKIRSFNLKIGFLVALTFVLFAFQYNVEERPPKVHYIIDIDETHVDPSVANYVEKKFIPPVTKKVEVFKKEILDLFEITTTEEVLPEEPDFSTADPEDQVDFSPVNISKGKAEAPIVAPVVEDPTDGGEIFDYVGQMPVFGDCTDLGNSEEKRLCSDKSIKEFIRNNLKYPSYAREVGLEGTVVAQFTIDKNGEVQDLKIVREVGGGTTEEVLRVINKMTTWTPGKQNFRPVNVRITLPVRFALN